MKKFMTCAATLLGVFFISTGTLLATPPPGGGGATTKLRTQDCGSTCLNLVSGISANAVTNATQYEFVFMNAADSSVYATKVQNSRTLVPNTLSPAPVYSGFYLVAVRAKVGGVFGNFGDTCSVAFISDPLTNAPPPTKIRNRDCGIDILKCGFLTADRITCANSYEFRIWSNGFIYATKKQTSPQLAVWGLMPQLVWGQTYQIDVRAWKGNVAGPYGAICTFNVNPDPAIFGFPTTALRSTQCSGIFNSSSILYSTHPTIYQTRYSNITANEFTFFNQSNSTVASYYSNTDRCPLNAVSGLIPGEIYTVVVRPYICNDHIGAYGPACSFLFDVTPATQRTAPFDPGYSEDFSPELLEPKEIPAQSTVAVEAGIYPQPSNGEAVLLLPDLMEFETANLFVYDLNGRLVFNKLQIRDSRTDLDLNTLADGMYVADIQSNMGRYRRIKLIRNQR